MAGSGMVLTWQRYGRTICIVAVNRFRHITLEDYVKHAAFDETGSGTSSNTNADNYFQAEKNAKEFIIKNYYPLIFSAYVPLASLWDKIKREAWLFTIHTYGNLKRLVGKG